MKKEMLEAAARAWDLLGLKPGEKFLVVTDHSADQSVARALLEQASMVSDQGFLVNMPPTGDHGREPPKGVTALMRECSVIVCPTTFSLTHTRARKRATDDGARVATMPGITAEMFRRTLGADYNAIKRLGSRVEHVLKKADRITVTTPSGTKILREPSCGRSFRNP